MDATMSVKCVYIYIRERIVVRVDPSSTPGFRILGGIHSLGKFTMVGRG